MAYYSIGFLGSQSDKLNMQEQIDRLQASLKEGDSIDLIDLTSIDFDHITSMPISFNSIVYYGDLHGQMTPDGKNYDSILSSAVQTQQEYGFKTPLLALTHEYTTNKANEVENTKLQELHLLNPDEKTVLTTIQSQEDLSHFTDAFISPLANSYIAKQNLVMEDVNKLKETMVSTITQTLKNKSTYTAKHVDRVSTYAVALGKELGLSDEELKKLEIASKFHDIGKIAIPQQVLDKPGLLTQAERNQINYHSFYGKEYLEVLRESSPYLQDLITDEITQAVDMHHADYRLTQKAIDPKTGEQLPYPARDELGYKIPLPGQEKRDSEIGKLAQIIAVADCIDAMTSQREYNNPKTMLNMFRDLMENSGTQFNPEYAQAAILMFGKQLASMGLDPTKLITDTKLKQYARLENTPDVPDRGKKMSILRHEIDVDRRLQTFLLEHREEFKVAPIVNLNLENELGINLDPYGHFRSKDFRRNINNYLNDQKFQKAVKALEEKNPALKAKYENEKDIDVQQKIAEEIIEFYSEEELDSFAKEAHNENFISEAESIRGMFAASHKETVPLTPEQLTPEYAIETYEERNNFVETTIDPKFINTLTKNDISINQESCREAQANIKELATIDREKNLNDKEL